MRPPLENAYNLVFVHQKATKLKTQQCFAWGCRDQSRVFCATSFAVCPTHCSQLDLNHGEFVAHNRGRTNSEFSIFLRNWHFSMMYNYVIIVYYRVSIDGTFYNFSVTRNIRIIHGNKKLSCRRETARCFVSLNILLTHSRSLKVIQSDTVE